ncbi:MAG: BamA/TamA family outer membrane protein [Fibrobacter sp.]|uniref:BamA/TamA family outer membrane protein n=1 Tax=Fibrobacter sp. TaxID=35828 RepID=UPI0025C6B905|nr:BamA/TamA family outer membrane protein [Fibrobacter sp.]MBQ7081213.1 BamA/TamA family outer membrane protein [Fibrobacter sp.]
MILLICALLFFSSLAFADDDDKNPWSVNISGNKVFSKFQLNEQLDIPDEFGQLDTIKQDFLMRLSSENVRALYYSRGYYSLDLKLVIQREPLSNGNIQRNYYISVSEGVCYRFNDAKIISSGDEPIPIDLSSLKITKHQYYNQEDLSEDLQEIQKAYRKQGNLHVYISSEEHVDTTAKCVNVIINVNPGPKVLMGNIITTTQRVMNKNEKKTEPEQGLSDTAWLSSLWRIKKGDVIDGNQYFNFKSKLYSTQLFTQVKLNDELREDGLSDVHLDVIERVPGETRYGFFFEEVYGFGALAYADHKNFFGKFNEFSANIQIAQHKQEITLGYANPLFLGTSFTFIPTAIRFVDRLSFNHEKINPPAYPDSVEERYEIINRGDLTFGITDNIKFRSSIDTRYVNKNNDMLFKFKGEIGLTFDYTNDYFNPTKGFRVMPTVGIGTNFNVKSDNSDNSNNEDGLIYTYSEATVNIYVPLFWTLYGALSGSVGGFFSKAIEDDARMFYQGGSRSVRGYRFRSIFASYTTKDPVTVKNESGQDSTFTRDNIHTALTPMYFRINEELRWTLPWKSLRSWQIVQFFDMTKVMDLRDDIYENGQEASLGLGIRYQWQFLTFRLDYAIAKGLMTNENCSDSESTNCRNNRKKKGFDWNRIAFDLSQAF